MSLTLESATETRLGGFVRQHNPWRGTLWCINCASKETRESGRWIDSKDCHHLNHEGRLKFDPCDGCHRPINECSPVVVEGAALIEHVSCKIF